MKEEQFEEGGPPIPFPLQPTLNESRSDEFERALRYPGASCAFSSFFRRPSREHDEILGTGERLGLREEPKRRKSKQLGFPKGIDINSFYSRPFMRITTGYNAVKSNRARRGAGDLH